MNAHVVEVVGDTLSWVLITLVVTTVALSYAARRFARRGRRSAARSALSALETLSLTVAVLWLFYGSHAVIAGESAWVVVIAVVNALVAQLVAAAARRRHRELGGCVAPAVDAGSGSEER